MDMKDVDLAIIQGFAREVQRLAVKLEEAKSPLEAYNIWHYLRNYAESIDLRFDAFDEKELGFVNGFRSFTPPFKALRA